MSSRDGLKHATVDLSSVGKLLCDWERDLQAGLIARWHRVCLIESRTRLDGADSGHARSGADGEPANASRPQSGDVGAACVQPPVAARQARRLIAAAVIAAWYLSVGLALVLASRGTEFL
jgi:hypothetical protein